MDNEYIITNGSVNDYDAFQEAVTTECGDLSVSELDKFIKVAMDMRNKLIDGDKDDDKDDDADEDDEIEIKDTEEVKDVKESYDYTSLRNVYTNQMDLEFDEPLNSFEFFDESYEPDNSPIVFLDDTGVFTQELTMADLMVAQSTVAGLIAVGMPIINMFITKRKYGRFPKDMKRAYDIIQSENFEASENKRALKKAFKAISRDLKYMIAGIGSRWKLTVSEMEELSKLKRRVDDLYTRGWMLTRIKKLSDKRRVPDRIEDFVKQGNRVMEMLNKSVYKDSTDHINEWMV